MASIGELAVNITARTGGFDAGVRKVASGAQKMSGSMGGMATSVGASAAGLAIKVAEMGAAVAAAGAAGVAAFAGWGVKLAAENEQAQASFTVLLGSAEKATEMLSKIRGMADVTPFESSDLRDSAQMLAGYGVAAKNIMPSLKMLGDLAMGDKNKLEQLTRAFAQIHSMGKLQGQDKNQMVNAGVNPLALIAEQTGESMAAVTQRMEAGGISAGEVARALQEATSEGGKFFGMMDQQAQTAMGRFSTLKDGIAAKARELGEALLPGVKNAMDMASQAMSAAGPGFTAVLQTLGEEFNAVFAGLGMEDTIKGALGTIDPFMAHLTTGLRALIHTTELVAAGILNIVRVQMQAATAAEDLARRVVGERANLGIGHFTRAMAPEMQRLEESLERAGIAGLKEVGSGQAFQEAMDRIGKARADAVKGATGTDKFDTTGLDDIVEKTAKAKDHAEKYHEAMKVGVGAVTQGSTAAFSAVQAHSRQAEGEYARKSAGLLGDIRGTLKSIDAKTGKEGPTIRLAVANL